MPYRPERQYRSFAASNFKPITRDEQGEDKQSYKVRGYFTTFNQEYELYPRMGSWPAEYEQIDRHAFDGVDTSDTIMQYDHVGPVMARTRNSSLTIGFDDHGGWCEADLSGCQQSRDLYESIKNGLVDEMSFGFIVANDDEGKGTTFTRDEQGDYHTTITRISRLYDVSAVGCPANPNTEIHSRSAIRAQIEADLKSDEQEPETRSADTEEVTDSTPIEGEVEEFDVESIAQRVAEILDIQYRKDDPRDDDPDDDPDDDTDDDDDPDDDDDDVKERAIVDETFKRRQRRMRAMRLATI